MIHSDRLSRSTVHCHVRTVPSTGLECLSFSLSPPFFSLFIVQYFQSRFEPKSITINSTRRSHGISELMRWVSRFSFSSRNWFRLDHRKFTVSALLALYCTPAGKEMVDWIATYLENIRERRVFPDVQPGYMRNLIAESAPVEGEEWTAIFDDVERVVMPGITHWQSPHMHAYFPALNSFPSLLGDMLADAINCLGFTWVWKSISMRGSKTQS